MLVETKFTLPSREEEHQGLPIPTEEESKEIN